MTSPNENELEYYKNYVFGQDFENQRIPVIQFNLEQNREEEDGEQTYVSPSIDLQTEQHPLLSNEPSKTSIVIYKELTAYKGLGEPEISADMLFTGDRGSWNFNIPPFLLMGNNARYNLIVRAVLDDHEMSSTNKYSLKVTVNNSVVHNGPIDLLHGKFDKDAFVNWRELTFEIPYLRRDTRVVIENTSDSDPDNWIAFDWMLIKFVSR